MFKLSQGKSGKFHFTLHAKNQQVVLTSEAYNTRAAATNGIASVKKSSAQRESFETRTAKNGEVIGTSQMYAHRSSVYVGIKSVMANAPKARPQPNSAARHCTGVVPGCWNSDEIQQRPTWAQRLQWAGPDR